MVLYRNIDQLALTYDWSGLERSRISLEATLIIVKGSLGFLGCAYINTDSRIDEACAIVSGVNTHDDMLKAPVKMLLNLVSRLV